MTKKNEYFEKHPVYSLLPYHAVIGFIQLLIDDRLVSPEEKNGFYIDFRDFRDKVRNMYGQLTDEQKQEYIAYFRYKHHLYTPFQDE